MKKEKEKNEYKENKNTEKKESKNTEKKENKNTEKKESKNTEKKESNFRKKEKKRKKGGKKSSLLPVYILLLMGVLVIGYPFFASYYNNIRYQKISSNFKKNVEHISKKDSNRKIGLEQDYNDYLSNPNTTVLETKKRYKKGIEEYNRLLKTGEMLGYVEIPQIDQSLPIYVGESDDVLDRGIGVMNYTSLPTGGNSRHCVLTGHSGMPTAKLFTDLNKMKVGDVFLVHNVRDTLAYKVDKIEVILPTNFSPLKIVKNKDYCTLLTCTPYMINTHRLIVRGVRIPYDKNMVKQSKKYLFKLILLLLLIVIIGIIILLIYRKKKKNNKKQENKN